VQADCGDIAERFPPSLAHYLPADFESWVIFLFQKPFARAGLKDSSDRSFLLCGEQTLTKDTSL